MALTPLTPPPKEILGAGWDLVTTEAGRSGHGLRATFLMLNGAPKLYRILALGNEEAQDAFIQAVTQASGLEHTMVHAAMLKLAYATEGVLREMDTARATSKAEDDLPGSPLTFEELEPWATPVHGAALLTALAETFATYAILPPGGKELLALWTLHTYALDATQVSPILGLTSPQKRCGKTTVLSLLRAVVWRPLPASNITPAAVFRTIEKYVPTLLVDEADTFMGKNDELRGVVNSGHTRSLAFVVRTVGEDHNPRQFSTWCPKAIALIGKLPDTLSDRTITLPLKRRTKSERIQKWRDDRGPSLTALRQQCLRWVQDYLDALTGSDPTLPESLHDRATDNWRPLVAIADTAGGEWPTRARQALAALEEVSLFEEDNAAVMLLTDLHAVFTTKQDDRILSRDLANELTSMEDRPWPEWTNGKAIAVRQIAKLLAPFGIHPKDIRTATEKAKGYLRTECEDAFSRYLPPERSATPRQTSNDADFHAHPSATTRAHVADEKLENPALNKGCRGVADHTPIPWRKDI
jgi:hypothetical protein